MASLPSTLAGPRIFLSQTIHVLAEAPRRTTKRLEGRTLSVTSPSPSARARQAGGSPALAATFFALLIDFDSGTGWVIDHSETSAHAPWAVALRWFGDGFFHQPITPFNSKNIGLTGTIEAPSLAAP